MTYDTITTTTNNPNHHNNHHYYPHSATTSSSASLKGCCCCLFLLFSFLALLTLTVVLVIFLAVKPRKPQFTLQQVAIQYTNLAATPPPFSATTPPFAAVNSAPGASLSLAIRMIFTAKNDNKVGIKYDESRFTIMYRGILLGRGVVPGFYQPSDSMRLVQTTVLVDWVNLMQADANELLKDAAINDRVELRILGDVRAKIRIVGLTSTAVQVSIDCAIAISPRKQALTYKQCGFDGLQL